MTHRIVLLFGMVLTALFGLSAVPVHAYGSPETAVLAPADTTPPANGMLTWGDNATQYRGQVGRRISFSCPPGGSLGAVWGADVYTDDSSICTAAVHAGVISSANGGSVTIEMRPGQGTYVATTRNGVATRSYGSWSSSYAFVGGLLTHPTIGWGTNAVIYRNRVGQRFSMTCPAGGDLGTVWGTDVYTDDSSICTAAAHVGIITRATGGPVTIEIRPGQTSYAASTRNGIASRSYGSWSGSYVIVGGGGLTTTATISWGAHAVEYRGQGRQIAFSCPPGGSLGTVWGTDVYTDDSSICTAAVHAGLFSASAGGSVTIEMLPGKSSYAASTRNGVTTRAYGSWSGSYRVVGGLTPTTSSTQPGVVPAGSHQVLTGTISAGDAARDDGSWYDSWTLQLSSGERVVIAMVSADFDTYLTVVSPSGAMTNDDDGGDGTNSRLELTADRAGSFTIMANTYRSGETGGYTLTVDR